MPGDIASYVFGQELGRGGMGVVYEGWLPSGQEVAIKLLHRAWIGDAEARRHFRDEAIAGGIVTHPNVVTVIDHGETSEGVPYLVMPKLYGEPLGLRSHRDGLPSLRLAATLVTQVLDGLAALHGAGIVHGDVKTDNVIVDAHDGAAEHAILIDFGLARVAFVDDRDELDDTVTGTPAYMAPEVAAGELAGMPSDVYGAGATLYELATGHTPFEGGTSSEVIARHIRDDVTSPSLVAPEREIPPILDRIILRALAKDPARRPSAKNLARALTVASRSLTGDHGSPSTAFSHDARTVTWRRPQRRLAAGTPGYRT